MARTEASQDIPRRGDAYARIEETITAIQAKLTRLREASGGEERAGVAQAIEGELAELRSAARELNNAAERARHTGIRSRIERIEGSDVKDSMLEIGGGLKRAAQEIGRGVSQAWTRLADKSEPSADDRRYGELATDTGRSKQAEVSPRVSSTSNPSDVTADDRQNGEQGKIADENSKTETGATRPRRALSRTSKIQQDIN